MSSTSALSDRIKIARNATYPDVQIATQVVLNCGTAGLLDVVKLSI